MNAEKLLAFYEHQRANCYQVALRLFLHPNHTSKNSPFLFNLKLVIMQFHNLIAYPQAHAQPSAKFIRFLKLIFQIFKIGNR